MVKSYVTPRLCLFPSGGTGNLLSHNERLFIVTCKHVAESFFKSDFNYVVLRGNRRIRRDSLSLYATIDGDLDLALIEVSGDVSIPGHYTVDDIEVIDDFSKHDFAKDQVYLCGFPEQMRWQDQEKRTWFDSLGYLTWPYKGDSPVNTENFFFCEYKKEVYSDDFGWTPNADAPGLSGAFVFRVIPAKKGELLWAVPSHFKVVGVQQTWHRKERWIKSTNAKHILKMLSENASENAV